MKNVILCLFLISLFVYVGCSSNSEDPGVDCDASTLELAVINVINPDCDTEGSFTLVASGGSEPYTYRLDGGEFQSSGEFSNLAAKSYTAAVMDADGCTLQGNFDLDAGSNGITISIDKTNSDCSSNNGSITINASGGDGSFTYSLDGGTAQESNSFNNVGVGGHDIIVEDGTGCTTSTAVFVSSNVSLTNDIMPLLERECTFSGCHNGTNSCGSSCNWTVKSNVRGRATEIKARTQSGAMPRDPGELTQAEIDLIACWVDDGALDN